jgi:RND family efflux transporter MFP subunit
MEKLMVRVTALILLLLVMVAAVVYNIRARHLPRKGVGDALVPMNNGSLAVTVSTARRRTIRQRVSLTGILRADRQVSISAKVPGRILAVLVREGERVRAGQPLVKLDIGDAQAQIASARAAVWAAEAQVRKAIEGKRARMAELDARMAEAEAGLRVAQAKLKQAEMGVALTESSTRSDAERAEAGVRQAEAGVRQAEAGLTQAMETLRRVKFLYLRGGVAKADLEGAQAQADIARSQRDAALAALRQAQAAARPAVETIPLRKQVNEADVEAARAGVLQAEEGLRNARRARESVLRIADRDIEAAKAQLSQAREGVKQALAQVGSSVLTSPFDGEIADVTAQAGEYAQPGMALMRVLSPASVYMEATAPARLARSLRPGRPVRVRIDTLPDRILTGVLTRIPASVNSDSRTLSVRIQLYAQGLPLTPGAMAKAEVDLLEAPHALAIPADALRNEGSVSFVYIVENGKALRRNVTLGGTEGEYVQILAGLKEGDLVILSGPLSLQSGTSVKIIGQD